MTHNLCDRLRRARDEGVEPIRGSRMVEVPSHWVGEAIETIERLSLRVDGYKASRDYSVERLAKALDIEDRDRALEWYASAAVKVIVELRKDRDSASESARRFGASLATLLDRGFIHSGPPTARQWEAIQRRSREVLTVLAKLIRELESGQEDKA